jgi:riboflavin biosynthesis pyrimidine reductase
VTVDLPVLEVLVDRSGAAGGESALAPEPGEPALARLYGYPGGAAHGPWVRANMISTVDGAVAGADGRSGSINGAADWRAFRVMRALADVVLVGAGTARTEGYTALSAPSDLVGLRERTVGPAPLTLAVVTGSGRVPERLADAAAQPDGAGPVLVVTTRCGAVRAVEHVQEEDVIVAGEDAVDLATALAALADHGLRRVLCEGGPGLLSSMLETDLVDELCLSTAPTVVGGPSPRAVSGSEVLSPARAARLEHLLHADGVLLARWNLRTDGASPVG